MRQIKKRAHQYAVAHGQNGNGVSLMRAYAVGALDERQEMIKRYNIHPKVFISGKISGIEYLVAYGKFCNADRKLSAMGYKVVNPMKICKKHWSWVRCMAKCLWAIMFCDKIYQLPGWQDSRGARIEYKWAIFLRKRIL